MAVVVGDQRVSITVEGALAEIKELCEDRAANGPDPRFQGQVWPSEILSILALVGLSDARR